MNHSKISTRYAKALFDLSEEKNILDQVKADMELIDNTIVQNHELSLLLRNPVISLTKKLAVINKLFGPHINKLTLLFLNTLTRKRREQIIEGVSGAFVKLYNESKKIKYVDVTSAEPLTATQKDEVRKILKNYTDSEIRMVEKIKSEIIGGFIIDMDNLQIDQSVTSKLKSLRKEFSKNLYVKGY